MSSHESERTVAGGLFFIFRGGDASDVAGALALCKSPAVAGHVPVKKLPPPASRQRHQARAPATVGLARARRHHTRGECEDVILRIERTLLANMKSAASDIRSRSRVPEAASIGHRVTMTR